MKQFFIVLSPYYQLIIVGYIIDNHVYPSLYALLKNKKQDTYTNIIRILEQLKETIMLRYIKVDFEPAFI